MHTLLLILATFAGPAQATPTEYIVTFKESQREQVRDELTRRNYRILVSRLQNDYVLISGPPGLKELIKIDGVVSVEPNRRVGPASASADASVPPEVRSLLESPEFQRLIGQKVTAAASEGRSLAFAGATKAIHQGRRWITVELRSQPMDGCEKTLESDVRVERWIACTKWVGANHVVEALYQEPPVDVPL